MDDREYELRRRELIAMLQTYKDERHNIERLTRLAISESEADLYPAGVDFSKDRVQCSFDSGVMGESMIIRASAARRHLHEVMRELKDKTQALDKLLLEITKLPAYQGRVIIGLYIDGLTESDIAEKMGKAEETIYGYRKAAIKRLTRSVMGNTTRSWRSEVVSAGKDEN